MKVWMMLICFILSFSNSSIAQNKGSFGKIGIAFTPSGSNDIIYFQQVEGAASYDGEGFFSIGLNYLLSINNTLDFETGVAYSSHMLTVYPNLPPNKDNSSHAITYSMITIPLTLRVNFANYIFVNGGLLVDIDANKANSDISQNGIGGIVGLGFNYNFESGLSVFANPYYNVHSLISFSNEGNYKHLTAAGFRFGMMYSL